MFAHSPLVGHGFGRYTYDSEKWPYVTGIAGVHPYYAFDTGVPHNEYLHILVLLGLLGFVPYVAILILAWRTAARHYREYFGLPGPRRDIALIFLSAFALFLTTGTTADAMFSGAANLQIYALLGAIDGLRVRESGIA
jgi:O-antigen ligase